MFRSVKLLLGSSLRKTFQSGDRYHQFACFCELVILVSVYTMGELQEIFLQREPKQQQLCLGLGPAPRTERRDLRRETRARGGPQNTEKWELGQGPWRTEHQEEEPRRGPRVSLASQSRSQGPQLAHRAPNGGNQGGGPARRAKAGAKGQRGTKAGAKGQSQRRKEGSQGGNEGPELAQRAPRRGNRGGSQRTRASATKAREGTTKRREPRRGPRAGASAQSTKCMNRGRNEGPEPARRALKIKEPRREPRARAGAQNIRRREARREPGARAGARSIKGKEPEAKSKGQSWRRENQKERTKAGTEAQGQYTEHQEEGAKAGTKGQLPPTYQPPPTITNHHQPTAPNHHQPPLSPPTTIVSTLNSDSGLRLWTLVSRLRPPTSQIQTQDTCSHACFTPFVASSICPPSSVRCCIFFPQAASFEVHGLNEARALARAEF